VTAGEEFLDFGQNPVGIGHPWCVVRAVDLEHPRAGNVVGEVPTRLHRNAGVLAGMDDQGGRSDRRQYRPEIHPEHRFERRPRHSGARAHALQHSELAYRPDRGNERLECGTASPCRPDGAAEFLKASDLGRRWGV
jgi:hypothetical protein